MVKVFNGTEEFPRRFVVDQMVAAELAIRNAMAEVENLGADARLTDAIVLLGMAKDKVSDFVDLGIPEENL
jgi:hypothetical protein